MRLLLVSFAVCLAGFLSAAHAGDRAVVVELYTSQGCSSCPPADDFLTRLSKREDVIPLALHVDYWDYLGWKDNFGHEKHSARQRGYAAAMGKRTIYTPQMVVHGVSHAVGSYEGEVLDLINQHSKAMDPVALSVVKNGNSLRISAKPVAADVGSSVVQLVRYVPRRDVKIRRGENAGRKITYTNIVVAWSVLGNWNGRGEYTTDTQVSGSEPVVIIVQEKDGGPILAAYRLP